jgi:hypothetical protein
MQLKISPSNNQLQQTSVNQCKGTEKLTESLHEKLFLCHSFTATQQATFLEELKCNLQSGEFVVLCNFAKVWSFVLQDETRASINPFIICFKKSGALNMENENLGNDTMLF